jgi:DNA polymerase (family 10)
MPAYRRERIKFEGKMGVRLDFETMSAKTPSPSSISSPTHAQCSDLLRDIGHLLELKGENVFKIRAFSKAADRFHELAPAPAELKERAQSGTLTEWEGIGKGIAAVLIEYIKTGASQERDTLAASLPEGLLELTRVPGLGPKKALTILEELEIRTLPELEYACRENRLLTLKGFGEKAQAKILEGIRFLQSTSGQKRLDEVFPLAEALFGVISGAVNEGRNPLGGTLRVSEAGALRRRMETLEELSFLIELPLGVKTQTAIKARVTAAVEELRASRPDGAFPVRLAFCETREWGYRLASLTASPAHWSALGEPSPEDAADEEQFYRKHGLAFIPAEMRETGEEIALARKADFAEKILPWDGVRGIFHNHTTRSDGADSLEAMVRAARERGYQYLGISDHSQSAFYAQGLKPDKLLEQEREVRELQEKYPDIRIFWGIESDILADGSLDYDAKMLKRFDFVIASVHSRFGMDREAMTERLVTAIRNPATRFVGHLTGRILLGRKGYEIDYERVLKAAAEHDVAIEINAHPARLDIDWRHGPEMRRLGVKTSVNPDAHEISGLDDVRYGVAVARKALLPASLVVNSWTVEQVGEWLARKS